MKRAPMNTMRNAPDIDDAVLTPKRTNNPIPAPTAPSINALQQRVNGMTGDSVTLHINGRDVLFKLRVIAAEAVERATMVFSGNERDQELLSENSLGDILPTFKTAGQQFPAIGRDINGVVEIADGSRRRAAAIMAGRSYRVLTGDLTDDEMKWLTKLGNDYTPPSAYERGKRYARMLKNDYDNNLSALATAEGISRRVLTRYVKTAMLPIEVIKAFSVPNDLSMKGGEALATMLPEYRDALIAAAKDIAIRRENGEEIDADDVFNELRTVADKKARLAPTVREFGKGVKAVYKGGKVTVQLKDAPDTLVKEIERLLEKHQRDSKTNVDLSLDELENVFSLIRDAAKLADKKLSSNEEKALLISARKIMAEEQEYDERVLRISQVITDTFV